MTLFVTGPGGGRAPFRGSGHWAKVEEEQGAQNQGESDANQHQEPPKPLKPREKKLKSVAQQVMTKRVQTLSRRTTVDEALQTFSKHEYHQMPVLSDTGKVVGMVTEGDLLRSVASGKQEHIEDIMEQHVICARPESEMGEVATVFMERREQVVPVVNERDELVGILTRGDLIRTIGKIADLDLWK